MTDNPETIVKLVPCPACAGNGRIHHRIPGVPADVCTRNSPCDACWPRDDDGVKVFWNDGTAGWVTEEQAAQIRETIRG